MSNSKMTSTITLKYAVTGYTEYGSPNRTVTFEIDSQEESLDSILDVMKDFLISCGYPVNGVLEVVDEEPDCERCPNKQREIPGSGEE